MGTQDKEKSRALKAKTTNFLMTDLDNFLKKPWMPSDENVIYSSLWYGEHIKVMLQFAYLSS